MALASDTGSKQSNPHPLTPHPRAMEGGEGDLYVEWLPELDTAKNEALALIVVRLDADTGTGAAGGYTITLDPATGSN